MYILLPQDGGANGSAAKLTKEHQMQGSRLATTAKRPQQRGSEPTE